MLRLKKEYKAFQESPFQNTAIEWSEERSDVWNVAMYGLFDQDPSIPFSFSIHFDKDYPIKPPSVGFNCPFPFSEGASYTIRDPEKVLNGKFVICLNILGNFAKVHDEWETAKGEGWSATCDVSYLLCQLFVVIGDNLQFRDSSPSWRTAGQLHERQEAHAREVKQAALAFKAYAETYPVPRLKVPLFQYPSSVSSEQRERIEAFYNGLSTSEQKEDYKNIIGSLFFSGNEEESETETKQEDVPFQAPSCCITFATSDDTLLFYGVAKETIGRGDKYNLITDCVPFSAEAGLKNLPTMKSPIEVAIPCWINDKHGTSPNWSEKTMEGVRYFSSKVLGQPSLPSAKCILKIYPDLINTLIVSMMKETDVTACSRLFEGIINLWRSFYHLIRINTPLQSLMKEILHLFIEDKGSRLKTVTPDVGHVLVIFFTYMREDSEMKIDLSSLSLEDKREMAVERPIHSLTSSFMIAFEHESSLRRPLWWQKDGIMITPYATYQKSLISVQNIAFQILFQKKVISATSLEEIDRTYCSLPSLLDSFLGEWKEVAKQLEANDSVPWRTYYEILESAGLPSSRVLEIQHPDYLKNLVAEACTLKGYHHISGGGGGGGGGGGRRKW